MNAPPLAARIHAHLLSNKDINLPIDLIHKCLERIPTLGDGTLVGKASDLVYDYLLTIHLAQLGGGSVPPNVGEMHKQILQVCCCFFY